MWKYCVLLLFVVAVAARPCNLTGINLSCGEYNSGTIPGNYGSNYVYPTASTIDYFLNNGMNVFRIPFTLERFQKYPGGPLVQQELDRLDATVDYITNKGKYVLLDPHNYGSCFNGKVGESASPISVFADFWFKMAQYYANNSRIIYGLMNEPNGQTIQVWSLASQAAVFAIRKAGASQLILVPGTSWTGAHSWIGSNSAKYMANLTDPIDNIAFEVHQYLDSDSSGTHDTCVSATIGATRLAVFTNWAKPLGKRGFLGEFGAGRDSLCITAIDNTIKHMEDNSDVYVGWTYWAGGPWWKDDYFSLLQPNATKADRPQWATIAAHINKNAVTLPAPDISKQVSSFPDYPDIVSSNLYIYDDNLNAPYADYSWATRNKQNSTYKHRGQYSYEFTMAKAYDALRFKCTGGCFDNSAKKYLSLNFYFMSPTGSTGTGSIEINLLDASDSKLSGSRTLAVSLSKTPQPYEWVMGSIPVTAFQKVNVSSVQFASTSSNALQTMFFDDISLVSSDDSYEVELGTGPTSKPTSTSTTKASTSATTTSKSSSTSGSSTSGSSTTDPSSSSSSSSSSSPSSTTSSSPTIGLPDSIDNGSSVISASVGLLLVLVALML